MTPEIRKMKLATRRENAVSSLSPGQVRLGRKPLEEGLLVTTSNILSSLASFDDRLEDDDFDLIEENLGVKVKRGVSAFFVSVLEDERRSP